MYRNKLFLARTYRWGLCNIENKNYSDFLLLFKLLTKYYSIPAIELSDCLGEDFVKDFKQSKTKKKQAVGFVSGVVIGLASIALFKYLKDK